MNILFVASQVNPAACTLAHELQHALIWKPTKKLYDHKPILDADYEKHHCTLIFPTPDVLHLDALNGAFPTDLIVILSTHRSASNTPALTIHATGNPGTSTLGGSPEQLCLTHPATISETLLYLLRNPYPGFETAFEVTHHGPSKMHAPLVFLEIGSTEQEWHNHGAARHQILAILHALTIQRTQPVAVGIGGPHYAPNFAKPSILEQYSVGHILSKNVLEHVTKVILQQAIAASIPHASIVLLDWKGIPGQQRQNIVQWLDELHVPWKRV